MTDDTPLTDAELTRLADGSLAPEAQAALRARVDGSADLQARLREQERAVTLMRATESITAPPALRASIERLAPAPAPRRPRRAGRLARWRPRVFLPAATALALAVAAIVVFTSGTGAPTVAQTAHVALARSLIRAPAVDPTDHDVLTAHVGHVPFPAYQSVTWRPSGARTDTLSGRRVTTVFYRNPRGVRIGYAIVSGGPLAEPPGRAISAGGVRYVLAATGSAKLITWRRDGHTCVIAGRRVDAGTLVALAHADERTA